MESFQIAERELAEELRKVCDNKGREVNFNKSSQVFNDLGLLYKSKSPDKISLIQSAALLNAAIIRQPSNKKFRTDLYDLCNHILKCANAENTKADLIKISLTAARKIDDMRKYARNNLTNIELTTETNDNDLKLKKEEDYLGKVKFLQFKISEDYKHVMTFISQKCIEIMGLPPCKFVLVGMGSLARREISPYSDFEHVLILENIDLQEEHCLYIKEFYRWYSVLFHIIVINLQETDLYSVCITQLNDHSNPSQNWFYDNFTCRGISFDGMMPHACHFPLGKTQKTEKLPWTTELIQPVDEMVKYLSAKDIKKGYKLGDLLTKTCYIDGDKTIYQQFLDKVRITLMQNAEEQQTSVMKQLEEDLDNFVLEKTLYMFTLDKSINIKQVVYRSITLFVSALGRLFELDLNINSGFGIIDALQQNEVVSKCAAHRLSHAVAVACHIRLSYYMSRRKQDDYIYKENERIWGAEKLHELANIVGISGLVECLATTYVLQKMLEKNISFVFFDERLQKNRCFAHLIFFNLLGLRNEAIQAGEEYLQNHALSPEVVCGLLSELGDSYILTYQYKKFLDICEIYQSQLKTLDPEKNSSYFKLKLHQLTCMFHLGSYEDVLKKSNALKKLQLDELQYGELILLNGFSKYQLSKYHEALSEFRFLQRELQKPKPWCKHFGMLVTWQYVSLCLIALERKEQGLHWAREAMNYLEIIGGNKDSFKIFMDIIRKNENQKMLCIPTV